MHTCCLGALLAYEGNCMWELFVSLGGTFNNHLGPCSVLLNMAKVMATKELGIEQPFASLTIGMFRSKASKRPVMRLKAAEARYFLPVLVHMLKKFFSCQSEHELNRLHCGQALRRCYAELRNWSYVDSPRKLEKAASRHLILYSCLSQEALQNDNTLCWHI